MYLYYKYIQLNKLLSCQIVSVYCQVPCFYNHITMMMLSSAIHVHSPIAGSRQVVYWEREHTGDTSIISGIQRYRI